ncbi:MAG: RNA-directed DNA polymerase [Chloroflexota bacterium]
MDNLSQASLDWTLTHIEKFGDTDIFPIPFEYKAIRHTWNEIRKQLVEVNLENYSSNPFRQFLMPKPNGGFRVAIQLSPIDTLIYTAMVYEAAELIEDSRINVSEKVACSYRVKLDAKGQLFSNQSGWKDFHEKSETYSSQADLSFVVLTDIADFYNQISHHRVRNALEMANVSSNRAANIENFLMELTARQSRGLPVGPLASILLAEATLNDVDMFLLRKGYKFTRYVDDFRIFCNSKRESIQALHDLSHYLNASHKLTLASGKTRIVSIEEFREKYLHDPQKVERRKQTEKISEHIRYLYNARYNSHVEFDEKELLEDRAFIIENLVDLFEEAISESVISLGIIRYLLRRATALDTNQLHESILDNLDKLTPAMRDVVVYFNKTARGKGKKKIGRRLIHFIETSDYAGLPYVQLWIINLLVEKFSSEFSDELGVVCTNLEKTLGKRPQALLAKQNRSLDWMREYREVWQNTPEWDRRAIIWASTALGNDERKHWLERVKRSQNDLDTIIAKAALGVN